MSNFRKSFVLSIITALLLWASENNFYEDGAPAQNLVIVLGTLTMVFAVISLAGWFAAENDERLDRRQARKARTPAVLLSNNVLKMPETVAVEFLKSPQALEIEMRLAGMDQDLSVELVAITDNDVNIPLHFLRSFVNRCNYGYLQPVSDYSDSKQRVLAQACTDLFISLDWAVPATGPYPAKWRVSYRKVLNVVIRSF